MQHPKAVYRDEIVISLVAFILVAYPGEARCCSTNSVVFNIPGVAGAVLQTPLLLIH